MHIRVILPVIGESLLEPVRGEVAGLHPAPRWTWCLSSAAP